MDVICFQLIPLDFAVNIYNAMDGQMTNGWTNLWTDRQMKRWTNRQKMSLFHTDAIDASENDDIPRDLAIITKSIMDGPTDQLTN